MSIAKATNSQKAIKPVDLKANSPEQVRFAQAMREVGVFYQTKRGETVPTAFRLPYLNTDLVEVGKLCLAAIFQMPCASRSKPSLLYQDKYYDPIFNGNQAQISKICKELLYIDNYFRAVYQKNFDRENGSRPNADIRISFAHNARTLCVAFVALASRYRQNNITDADLTPIFSANYSENIADSMYGIFKNIGDVNYILSPQLFADKDRYDKTLNDLFNIIIEEGVTSYLHECHHDLTLTATNYLKKDKNYYDILSIQWSRINNDLNRIFSEIGM